MQQILQNQEKIRHTKIQARKMPRNSPAFPYDPSYDYASELSVQIRSIDNFVLVVVQKRVVVKILDCVITKTRLDSTINLNNLLVNRELRIFIKISGITTVHYDTPT